MEQQKLAKDKAAAEEEDQKKQQVELLYLNAAQPLVDSSTEPETSKEEHQTAQAARNLFQGFKNLASNFESKTLAWGEPTTTKPVALTN